VRVTAGPGVPRIDAQAALLEISERKNEQVE
jgi:hypothetical protein